MIWSLDCHTENICLRIEMMGAQIEFFGMLTDWFRGEIAQ